MCMLCDQAIPYLGISGEMYKQILKQDQLKNHWWYNGYKTYENICYIVI